MSLHPHVIEPVPDETARVAHAGSCPCTLRINTTGAPVDLHRIKKA